LSGNDQHLSSAATAVTDSAGLIQISNRRDLVLPSNDTLFTSGTLGHYSAILNDLQQNEARRHLTQTDQTAAD
jgi:NADH-quinone oxidoreductase subunit G